TAAHLDAHMGAASEAQLVRIPVPVTNSGSKSAVVSVERHQITTEARQEPAIGWLQTATPKHFTLEPGATKQVVLVLSVPGGQTGRHELNVQFSAASEGGRVDSGIQAGTTIEFHQPGPTVPHQAAPYAGPSHATPASGGIGAAGLAAVLAL